jgi:hypothetical protein
MESGSRGVAGFCGWGPDNLGAAGAENSRAEGTPWYPHKFSHRICTNLRVHLIVPGGSGPPDPPVSYMPLSGSLLRSLHGAVESPCSKVQGQSPCMIKGHGLMKPRSKRAPLVEAAESFINTRGTRGVVEG